jgi:hypothetical protein
MQSKNGIKVFSLKSYPFPWTESWSFEIVNVPHRIQDHQRPKASEQQNVPWKPNWNKRKNDPYKDVKYNSKQLRKSFKSLRGHFLIVRKFCEKIFFAQFIKITSIRDYLFGINLFGVIKFPFYWSLFEYFYLIIQWNTFNLFGNRLKIQLNQVCR